ncbi:MAG: hypothetical protein HYX72_03125 [Acidobacteria bacterium]|nr:hypothetical protein [Acidobacteriota bacterium]
MKRKDPGPESVRAIPSIGINEWFRPNDRELVENVLADMKALSIRELRTGISWSDFANGAHDQWYEWLFERLVREVRIPPCFVGTPENLALLPKSSAPPRDYKTYSEFVRTVITRFGNYLDHVELWNEPNNLYDWDWRLDPDWHIFAEMIGAAANTAHELGKKTVLAGMCPTDLAWLKLMFDRIGARSFDAVGIHGFPGAWEFDWEDWHRKVSDVRSVLEEYGSEAEIWITKTGFSTWRHDEHQQLRAFVKATEASVDRMYWYAARDLDPDLPAQGGFHVDERHYHFGLKRSDGTSKLLFRLWAQGGGSLRARSPSSRFNVPPELMAKSFVGGINQAGRNGYLGCEVKHLCRSLYAAAQPVAVPNVANLDLNLAAVRCGLSLLKRSQRCRSTCVLPSR